MYALIDGSTITDREGLHDALARQLALPDWYGRNLDALFDCLSDIREDVELRLVNTDALFANLGVYVDVLQAVLRDASAENPHIHLLLESTSAREV